MASLAEAASLPWLLHCFTFEFVCLLLALESGLLPGSWSYYQLVVNSRVEIGKSNSSSPSKVLRFQISFAVLDSSLVRAATRSNSCLRLFQK